MKEPIDLMAVLEEIFDAGAALRPDFGETAASSGEEMHPDAISLYEYLQKLLPASRHGEVEVHASGCPHCRVLLGAFQESIEIARGIDIALPPKRAAAPGDVVRVSTRGKQFELTLRPSLRDSSRGVLIVRTQRTELEGKRVVVRDAGRRELLRGRFVQGEASQQVENIEGIRLGKAVIVAL